MTPKQIALKNVTFFFFSAIVSGILLALAIDFFGLAVIGTALSFVMLAYLVKIVYDMEVDRAESLEKLNNPRG